MKNLILTFSGVELWVAHPFAKISKSSMINSDSRNPGYLKRSVPYKDKTRDTKSFSHLYIQCLIK